MQQNARSLHRRAPFIVRLRPCLRPRRRAFVTPWPYPSHQIQPQCASSSAPRGSFLGDLPFPHLGGKHYFKVRIPDETRADDIDAWLEALDTCLPAHLRSSEAIASAPEQHPADISTRRDLALVLIQAQKDGSLNILEHLGVEQQRWDAVSWIVQTIANPGPSQDVWSTGISNAPLQCSKGGKTLDEFVEDPVQLGNAYDSNFQFTLDQATVAADPRLYDTRLQRGAMGQIWHALGRMAIKAADTAEDAKQLMPHVLSLLATLHHHGIVPEQVYREAHYHQMGAIQQPPLLYMLSSKILTALSDAAWDAKQATVRDTEKSGKGKYSSWSFGLESPGVRYRASAQEIRPEVWLELILWSCLHGGWIEEGAAVVDEVTSKSRDHKWSLFCWQNAMESTSEQQAHRPTFGWRDALDILEGARPELQPRPSADDKAAVVRTVSSEVVAAYIDAMINRLHVGVGQRGARINEVIEHVWQSKRMLAKQNLGLGFATWDAIVQRFMESGAVSLERDTATVRRIAALVEVFGTELGAENALTTSRAEEDTTPYFMHASAVRLTLHHRMLHRRARSGDFLGTMEILRSMYAFTEMNQRRSIEQFFRDLKERPHLYQTAAKEGLLFNTGLAAAEYPSFYLQLPVYALAEFLNVAKNIKSKNSIFHRWIFDSREAAGPMVSEGMLQEAGLAPALVRFASTTNDQEMLQEVMTHFSQLSQDESTLIPTPILTALVEALMQRQKWDAVRNIMQTLVERCDSNLGGEGFNTWEPRLLPVLIRELLRQQKQFRDVSSKAMDLFRAIVSMPRKNSDFKSTHASFFHVALLATVDPEWGRIVNHMRVFPSHSIPLRNSTEAFNIVLEGMLETHGLAAAKQFWELWCYDANWLRRRRAQEGGIFYVPRKRPSSVPLGSGLNYRVLVTTVFPPVDFAGRVPPDLHSVRLMQEQLLKLQQKQAIQEDEFLEMREWLRGYVMALSHGDYESDGELARLDEAMDMFVVE